MNYTVVKAVKYIDLDSDLVDLICFVIAAILAVIAHFFPRDSPNGLAEFSYLAAGSALRGLGAGRGNFDEPL
jgi:hypothetical protein